jgi:hypothetical protein
MAEATMRARGEGEGEDEGGRGARESDGPRSQRGRGESSSSGSSGLSKAIPRPFVGDGWGVREGASRTGPSGSVRDAGGGVAVWW